MQLPHPFEYYSTIKIPYPSRNTYRQSRLKEINDAPMTADERMSALNRLPEDIDEWHLRETQPHLTRQQELLEEFWSDCRSVLKYDRVFDEDHCKRMEQKSLDAGFRFGIEQVYHLLVINFEESQKIVDSFIRKRAAAFAPSNWAAEPAGPVMNAYIGSPTASYVAPYTGPTG